MSVLGLARIVVIYVVVVVFYGVYSREIAGKILICSKIIVIIFCCNGIKSYIRVVRETNK